MQTYRIVVGVDGSEGGNQALAWAVAEAAGRGGTVQAVIAWQWTQPDLGVDIRTEHEQTAWATLQEAVDAAHAPYPQVTISTEAACGPAAEVLTGAAAGADLLVLGSHGHGRLFHAVLGSTTEACVRAALCPVVVVPQPRAATNDAATNDGAGDGAADDKESSTPISTATY